MKKKSYALPVRVQTGPPTVETSIEVPQDTIVYMTQLSHSWVFIQRAVGWYITETHAHQHLLHHHGTNLDVYLAEE